MKENVYVDFLVLCLVYNKCLLVINYLFFSSRGRKNSNSKILIGKDYRKRNLK